MLTSVVVVSDDRSPCLERQLARLAEETAGRDVTVVLAHRGRRRPRLPDAVPEHLVVEHLPRASAPAARTAGARAAAADVVLLCDAAGVVRPGWVDALVEATSSAGVAGGWVAYSPGPRGERWGQREPRERLPVFHGWRSFLYADCCAVRRDALAVLEGWRDRYAWNHDGVDLAFRAARCGIDVGFAPGAVVDRQLPRAWEFAVDRLRMGAMDPALYADHGPDGFPPRSLRQAAGTWGWSLAHAPDLLRSFEERRRWIQVAGESAGRAAGSLRYRVRYL